ncbi:basic proline-rich protein-like [Falco cherrug]|uniref:basic proline-rich protein-like n=1 Tax=Falco cherrug TaxID=345164 RepID=UPI00247A2F0F|nr:basic proline-rich protein-like [Falco cherrug]
MIVFTRSGLLRGKKTRRRGGSPRSPQVRGLREGRRLPREGSAPPRCGVPAGAVGGGPPPRGLLGRAGRRRPSPGLSSAGRAAGEGVGAPQFPSPPPPRQRDAAAAAAGGVGAPKPPPAGLLLASPQRCLCRRLPGRGILVRQLPLSASSPCRVAAGAGRERGGFLCRLIPSPFFFNGGHRDESRGPPAALPLAAAPSRGAARRWPPPPLGEGGCSGAARPLGACTASESRAPSSLGGRHLVAAVRRGAAGCAAGLGAARQPPPVRGPPPPARPAGPAASPGAGGAPHRPPPRSPALDSSLRPLAEASHDPGSVTPRWCFAPWNKFHTESSEPF